MAVPAHAEGGDETGAPASSSRALGITGTTNFWGDLQTEINAALMRQAAYGIPGTRSWGEWEKIARTDPDCSTGLDKVVAPLRDSRLSVKAAVHRALPEAVAAKHAEFVEWALLNAMPRWSDFSQRLARGFLTYGFSLHEKLYVDCEHGALPGGRGVTIGKFAERLPQSLHSSGPWLERESATGEMELETIRQQGQRGGKWGEVLLPASKCLLISWNRSGDNYAGYSVFRPVYYHCKIREQLARIIAIGAQREALGIPSASATGADAADLTPEQRSALTTLLMSLTFHENAAVVMPRGWEVKWIHSPARDKTHLVDLYNALGVLILRTLSAQQVALGTGETGSRSVGEVHNAVANEFVQGVVSVIEGALGGIAKELVEMNFGAQPAYPEAAVTLKKSQLSAGEKALAAKQAVDAGLLTPTLADENAMREELGFAPVIASGEDAKSVLLNGAQALAAQSIVQAVASGLLPRDAGLGMLDEFFGLTVEQAENVLGSAGAGFVPLAPATPGAPPAPEVDDAPEPKPSPPAKAKARAFVTSAPPAVAAAHFAVRAASREPWAPRRPLRASEQGLDLAGMDGFLTRARDDFERGAKPLVAEMVMGALPAVRLAMADGDPSELATVVLDSKRLDAFVAEYLRTVWAEGQRQVRAELKGAPPPERVTAAAGDENEPPLLRAQRLQAVRRITTRLGLELEARAIDVVRTGGDPSEVVSGTLADMADSAALRTDGGLLTTKAWSGGREDAARELGGIAEVELSAVLDTGTCGPCEALDGARFDFESAEHDAHVPPLRQCEGRDNCRCLLLFIPAPRGGE